MNFLTKYKRALPIVLLPIVSYEILGPLEIYFGNQPEMPFLYTDFLGYFLVFSVAVWLLVSAVIATLPERVGNVIGALILGFGVASYIQNMFMNVKLSELDGSPMNWEALRTYTFINWVIWVVIVLAVLCIELSLKKYWNTFSMAVSGFLSAIQIVAVVFLLITAAPLEKNIGISLQASGEKQLSVAPNDNIIVFVLDSAGNTYLERMLEIYPDALDGLHDFTFYNNTDCHYYFTFPSVTHFLTGEDYDFEIKSQDWLKKAWASDRAISFWDELHKADYTCNLYSADMSYVYGDVENLEGKFDNIIPMRTAIKTKMLIGLLEKMSTYKYVPYVLKPIFEMSTNEFAGVLDRDDRFATNNGEFYQQLKHNKLSISSDMKNALLIQHIDGMHEPFSLDENANTTKETTAEDTMKGLTVILDEYLKQLRDLGVYDNAAIIITADHGLWDNGDTQPIFFIKRRSETHDEVQVNTAPISLDDFQPTILDILGKDYSGYGTSIYDWSEGDLRERTLYMKTVDNDWPKITGSSVYHGYTYSTDKEELNRKIEEGSPDVIEKVAF